MLSIILSSLALAAAAVCVAVVMRERKRSREQNAAQEAFVKTILDDRDSQWKERLEVLGDAWEKVNKELRGQIADLESGAVPDYERAKAAAKAVDDFHSGLANILNYDPYEAVRIGRSGGGDAS